MIEKIKSGYKIVSKTSGKNLGKFKTKKQAKKRLREIEYFKHTKSKKY